MKGLVGAVAHMNERGIYFSFAYNIWEGILKIFPINLLFYRYYA